MGREEDVHGSTGLNAETKGSQVDKCCSKDKFYIRSTSSCDAMSLTLSIMVLVGAA